MPDRRRHRGPHPEDAALFGPATWPALAAAVGDLAWLLGRGYAEPSALKLVGDRHALDRRQRLAVLRATCTEAARRRRRATEVRPEALGGRALVVDGYNVLITVEAALGGGVLILARDGCLRDVASLHGSFRRVAETEPALEAIATWLARHQVGPVRWLLDRPVSNSGRLAALVRAVGERHGRAWTTELPTSADPLLLGTADVVATADSVVLDRAAAWLNLARHVVADRVPGARPVDLSQEPAA